MPIIERLLEERKKIKYLKSFLGQELVHVNLQLLYECNFHCRICDFWTDAYRNKPKLSAAQARVISDRLAEIGPQIVSIGGGEPLLHPEISAVVAALATYHFPVMICNGWFVDKNNARDLWAAGMYEISVSVDYADAGKHDTQRGMPGAYERALRALEVLHKYRTRRWQRVHMISVVMEDNIDEIEGLIKICRDMGITYLVTLYSDHRGQKQAHITSADISAHLLDLKRRYPQFVTLRGYINHFTRAVREGGIADCRAGINLFNIDSQGDVSTCIDHLTDSVGNILFEDIHTLIKRLQVSQRSNVCKGCWTSCRGTIETLMYGRNRFKNYLDYYQMAKSVAINSPVA